MNWILTLVLYVVSGTCHDTGITWQLLTRPVYFGQDVLMSCYRPYFKGDMYLAWLNKTADYIGRGNISFNETKYGIKLFYTNTGINYTLTIKSFDSDDVNTTYRCYMGFESYLADLKEMNTTFLYPPRSEDISIVYRSEKKEMIQVAIWKAFPKPTCHIFVGNSRIEESYEATYERVSVFYKVTFCFSYEALSKYCDNVLLITCFIGKTAFNYTRGIPIDCKETGKSPHATSEWLFMLLIIPGIIVLLTLVFLFNRRKTGILCWNVDGNSSENVPRLNETLLAKTSLLNNPDLKEAAS